MGLLADMDLENVPDLTVVAEGEWAVRILEAGEHVGKESGKTSIKVVLSIDEDPNAESVYHYLALPAADDDEKTRNNKMRRIKTFLNAFGLDKGMEYRDWVGATCYAYLGLEADQNGENRNTVKRFIEPK